MPEERRRMPARTRFVDAYPTPTDGDPELNCDLQAGAATLGDTSKGGVSYSVTFALSPVE
jgi:hypothetical protein